MASPEDALTKEIQRTYAQAAKEIKQKTEEFWTAHKAKAAQMLADVASGKITQEDYKKWLRGQVFTGNRWKEKLDDITKTYVDADKKAREIIGGTTKNVFIDAANRTAYDMEKDLRGGVSFDLYDGKTVSRLLKDNPKMLPEWKINEPKDYVWNEKRVRNAVAQGIIQGESIAKIGKRLTSELATSNGSKMDMFARTAVTGAQNAGRMERLHEAEDMGIEVKKQWIATHDSRVRDAHAYLDGQIVGVDEKFEVDGAEIDYPGDPLAPPELVYNCRCTLAYIYPKYQKQNRWEDQTTGEELPYKTFSEWKAAKHKENKQSQEKQEQTNKTISIVEKVNKYSNKIQSLNSEVEHYQTEYQKLSGESIMAFGTDKFDKINTELSEIENEISQRYKEIEKTRDEMQKYLKEPSEKEIKKAFGTIEKKHSIYDDANSINRISADSRSQLNCGFCSLAYDARRRGIDCKAVLANGTNNNQIETWFDGLKMGYASSYSPQEAMKEIVSEAEKWGAGSRGIVQVDYTATSGHYFVFEVDENGKCVFADPQTGTTKGEMFFSGARPGSVMFGRTDDKELTRAAYLSLEKGGLNDE